MPRPLHLINAAGRDATVQFETLKAAKPPRLGLPGGAEVQFRRYLGATEDTMHEALVARFGADYGEALLNGDPEVDLEQVGRRVAETQQVYLSGKGEVLHAPPEIVEIILLPDGSEKERREPQDLQANVNDELPVRWSRIQIPLAEVASRFAFQRTLQVRHVDGLTFDYLYAMAKELHEKQEAVLLGGGPKGRDPLRFSSNGTPWRGFLTGRLDGDRYQLLLHLSNMELKRPPEAE